ncbi:MAG: glycosyltransferase [Firmicutes bacterium HGW-Firmicutes-1]|jgi:N-acetylglucosaminyldiphosphoundecaprenol N-acetyl-beta-D-mannosaminyltransferase|nr:MAG: glycosyltransferase [Firmicutes bacterium HGW-Firmicutes-1]
MKSNKINILGVHFDAVTMNEATKLALSFLEDVHKRMIFTANPEIVMEATKNSDFLHIINKGDLIVADGIGVVIGSKIIKNPLPERVAGYDLVQNIFKAIKSTEKTVYFFGAAPGIANKAAKRMMHQHNGLKIVGTHDGYFDKEEEQKILLQINELKPDLLLIGLGAPKQEKWLFDHIEALNVKVCIGVGGSFDVMSGEIKRAPKLFIKLGLEWFYRLITQPTRLKRMMKLPIFLVDVFIHRKEYR